MTLFASLALSTVATLHAADALLPATPEGWRYERLDFPLSFAPDLDHEGFEELRFAPGMFEPESDSYFTYVLALRLEGDVNFDGETLTTFLDAYYRGLCHAVAKTRNLDLDLARIAVDVERAGDRFDATVEMVDAFVTGKPLTLHLEVDHHAVPGATEVFAAASPAPTNAAIWDELRAIAGRWRAARPAPLFFNHLFIVPDAETYAALSTSDFLRGGFGVFEERTTVRDDRSYTGVYLYGDQTYFECLSPETLPEGRSGIAFGIERPGGIDDVASRLSEHGIRTFLDAKTRKADAKQVPWFRIMGVEQAHGSSRIDLFAMEYDPRFLQSWHADLPPRDAGIARRDVLTRYAAKLGRADADAVFQDVDEVSMTVDEPERLRVVEMCRQFGYVVETTTDGWMCRGPQCTLVLRASDRPGRITGFRLRLRRPVEREPLRLGALTIRFEGTSATVTLAD